MGYLTPDFTHTLDSAGNAWTILPEKGFLTGQATLGDVVRELEELDCDVRVLPNGTFQAFISQGSNVSSTVWLQEGVNLLGLTYQGTPVRATKALVRTLKGWTIATDSGGVSAYGKRYMGITAGTTGSALQGRKIALRTLDETASPRYVYTATVRAVAGAVPFLSFDVGDTIKCPNYAKVMTSMRVLSITASTPDDAPGPVTFTLELDVP